MNLTVHAFVSPSIRFWMKYDEAEFENLGYAYGDEKGGYKLVRGNADGRIERVRELSFWEADKEGEPTLFDASDEEGLILLTVYDAGKVHKIVLDDECEALKLFDVIGTMLD